MAKKVLKTKKKILKVTKKKTLKVIKKTTVKTKQKVVGKIIHYFRKIKVAVIKVSDTLKVGDQIRIIGGEKEFTQLVGSMQIDYKEIKKAEKGKKIGLKVKSGVREGYKVYKIN